MIAWFISQQNLPVKVSTIVLAFILVLIGLSISKNKLLSDTNSNYSLVITIIACITSFFISERALILCMIVRLYLM